MSTRALFAVDLPSDSESDDSDYVTENEGSASSSEMELDAKPSHSYKKQIQRVKINKLFESLVQADEDKVCAENHSDVLIDPLMLDFQRVQPRAKPKNVSLESIEMELSKYSNSTTTNEPLDVRRYKQMARGTAAAVDRVAVERARAGISNAKVEIEEEVRFAGEIVKTKKLVERTSQHAARYERRKRAAEEQASLGEGTLGEFQTYLNQIKSHRGVSSVEKSASDWNQLKMSTEGMEETLQVDRGFIEKQAFLIRSGAKEDELRREARRKKLLMQEASQSRDAHT